MLSRVARRLAPSLFRRYCTTGAAAVRTKSKPSPEVEQQREIRKEKERNEALEAASAGLPSFQQMLRTHGKYPLLRMTTKTLQINVGKLCNQTCHHCHVEAGPTKTRENMDLRTAQRLVDLMKTSQTISTVDLTGGAPELNPHFRLLVTNAFQLGKTVIDRCNLTVLFEPGQETLARFLAEKKVQIVASLPCYSPANVEKQRGKGVFEKSVAALQQLNKLGYGKPGSGLELHLVYNPVGPSLPPPQAKLEAAYKQELKKHMDIDFNKLFTITNMPIKRFADSLLNTGKYQEYMSLLVNHFNATTVDHLMCRDLVSVGWDGTLYDCDFNQMLEIPIGAARTLKPQREDTSHPTKPQLTVWDVTSFDSLTSTPIAVGRHCYGCTAGSGSSCGGSLT